jgi:hypothetical protein
MTQETTERNKFAARVAARRAKGGNVIGYVVQLVRDNRVPLEDLDLLPEEMAAFEEYRRIEEERKAREGAEAEVHRAAVIVKMQAAKAAFHACLEDRRTKGLPTEQVVDVIHDSGNSPLGIELTDEMLVGAKTMEELRRVLDGILKAVNWYERPDICVAKTLKAVTTPDQLRALLADVLTMIARYDDSYHNKNLVVVRLPDPDDYEIVDLGNYDYFRGENVTILGGFGFGESYRFVDEDDEDDEEDDETAA